PRTYFKAPRVPFDFRGVTLAVFGYLVYWAGGLLLSEIFGKKDVPGAFLAAAVDIFRGLPFIGTVIRDFLLEVFKAAPGIEAYTFWDKLVGAAWFFAVWSFFGQAIHRIVSLRIARDEGLSLGEALKFAAKNWPTVLLVPAIVAGAMAFFYGCNTLGGLVVSIPWIGQILGLVIIPLAVISTLLILLIGIGGAFGMPLIGAAAAWERNGTLDAISRAFSYIFARPLQFFWNYFLIFLFIGVILLIGSWFTYTLVKSVDAGAVFSDEFSVTIDAPRFSNEENSEFAGLSNDAKDLYVKLADKTKYTSGARSPNVEPFALDFHTVIESPWSQKLNAFVFWAALNLIWLGIFGYAVYWFMGASTSVYADLRADVDGTEEDEIYLEEEEEDFDAFQEAVDRASETEGEAPKPEDAPPAGDTTSSDAEEGGAEAPSEGSAGDSAEGSANGDEPNPSAEG
ncbi:MAG: hypothetical protein ACC662_02210, partial [Planctomycetota bacterium]